MRIRAPWTTRRERRAEAADEVRALQLIDALNAYPREVSLNHDVTITVPWDDAAHVRDLVHASGLPIGGEFRYAIEARGELPWKVRIETSIRSLTVARHVAAAAAVVERQLRDGHTNPDLAAHTSLRDALADPRTLGATVGEIHAELSCYPFGDDGGATADDDTLAILLLGNTEMPDEELTTNYVGPAAMHLIHALAHTPELLDVATALDQPADAAALTVSRPPHRPTTGRSPS